LSGQFAECGVYRGGTALLFSRLLSEANKKLFLFDSFEGLPEANKAYDKHYGKGDFADTSLESVRQVLKDFHHFIEFRQGWIPSTFEGLADQRWAFVHVDVDLFQSALDCCEYFYPRLVSGGVMVFDDYGFAMTRGDKDAVDQFFLDKPEPPLVLPTGQAVVVKLPSGDILR
jgi:O-methyltransferase